MAAFGMGERDVSAARGGFPARKERLEIARIAPFWTILAIVLLFGGASRADALSQIVVRLGAVLVIGWSVLTSRGAWWRDWPTPWRLLALLGAWMAIQLVPVPPLLWRAQPGAAPFAAALDSINMGREWRQLSLSPDLTLNSLFALLPLLALGVTGARLTGREVRTGLAVVLGAVALGALIGVGQVAGAAPSFFRVTNEGSEVGLFANRNHHAAILCCALPLLGALAATSPRGSSRPWILLACGILILPLVLATGSRGGLVTAPIAGLLGVAIAMAGRRREAMSRAVKLGVAGAFAATVGVTALMFMLGRDRSIARLFAPNEGGEVRFDMLGTFARMAREFGWTGAGFGTFDPVFRSYEPSWALGPAYLNHAHNDLIELVIEGGIPALVLLGVLLFWVATRSVAAWRRGDALARAAAAVLVILLAWSLLDYPLRTPALAALAGWCVLLLARPVESGSGSGRGRSRSLASRPASANNP